MDRPIVSPTDERPRVCLVTGAARGIGRSIALALARPDTVLYLTDRHGAPSRPLGAPGAPPAGTVESVAREVEERGAAAVAVPLDHRSDDAVAGLIAAVEASHGQLDVVVANAFAGNDLPFRSAPFWELERAHWTNMFDCGVRSHLVTAQLAAPVLAPGTGALVFTGLADSTGIPIASHAVYDLAMVSIARLVRTTAADLRPRGVDVVGISPRFTATEAIVAAIGSVPASADPIELPGRCVAALLDDPQRRTVSGTVVDVGALAVRYGLEPGGPGGIGSDDDLVPGSTVGFTTPTSEAPNLGDDRLHPELAVDAWWQALADGDVDRWSSLLSEEYTVLGGPNGPVVGRDAVMADAREFSASGRIDAWDLHERMTWVDDRVAVCSYAWSEHGSINGEPFRLTGSATDVLVEEHGRWWHRTRHVSVDSHGAGRDGGDVLGGDP